MCLYIHGGVAMISLDENCGEEYSIHSLMFGAYITHSFFPAQGPLFVRVDDDFLVGHHAFSGSDRINV